MNDLLISIIVPVYNVEQYLEECLNSIKNQSYSNIEVLLIDDGSTDKSGVICDSFSHNDKRFVTIHKDNNGPSSAKNIGIRESKGDLITFIDSDDWIDKDCVETLVKEYVKNKADIVAFSCIYHIGNKTQKLEPNIINVEKIEANGIRDELIASCIVPSYNHMSLFSSNLKYGPTMYTTCCKLYRRDVLISSNIYYQEEIKVNEDRIFNIEVGRKISTILFVNLPFYHYRARTGSLGHSKIEVVSNNYINGINYMEEQISEIEKETRTSVVRDAFDINKIETSLVIFKKCCIKFMKTKNYVNSFSAYNNFTRRINLKNKVDNSLLSKSDKILFSLLKNNMIFLAMIVCVSYYLANKDRINLEEI